MVFIKMQGMCYYSPGNVLRRRSLLKLCIILPQFILNSLIIHSLFNIIIFEKKLEIKLNKIDDKQKVDNSEKVVLFKLIWINNTSVVLLHVQFIFDT